jgi:hypothetical protein
LVLVSTILFQMFSPGIFFSNKRKKKKKNHRKELKCRKGRELSFKLLFFPFTFSSHSALSFLTPTFALPFLPFCFKRFFLASSSSQAEDTTTKEGHIAIQISSQTTKKTISKNLQFRTTIPRKLLSLCETLTFPPVQLQALRNSRN